MNNNETALQVINKAAQNGAMICFDRNNGFPQVELYRTEITEIIINKKDDCFFISKKYMPKKETVDRIGEAAGVLFVMGETKTQTLDDPVCGKRTVYIGIAQGKVRMPDGTWRTSSVCEYEFDPTLRAMSDFDITELTPETKQKRKNYDGKPYGNNLALTIMEYQKMARQRANTGARLRVIRELTSFPIALTEEQISKPVVFGRIVQNTSYILQTPQGQAMATAQALGVDVSSLFGGKNIADNTTITTGDGMPPEHTPTKMAEETPPSREPDFPEEPTNSQDDDKQKILKAIEEKGINIDQLMVSYKDALDVTSNNGKNPYKMAQDELNNPDATIESRNSMIKRLNDWLKNKGIKV